jgi:serine/threonine-protein kinase HipA
VLAAEGGQYLFTYGSDAGSAAEVSLLMPVRAQQYAYRELHPIFQMNMPEGYVLEQLRQRFAKTTPFDPLLLLAITGRTAPIGRVHIEADVAATPGSASRGERLSDILAWDGAESIFDALAERYLLRSGVSGVQPKLLVPETMDSGKVAIATSELIVKSGGGDYPGLAVNEYLCMSIAREAGVPVPEFFLSDDGELFVMRRFDRERDGRALGFEDMAVLTGRGAQQKYEGSYEQIGKAVQLFCSEDAQRAALDQLFDQVALSCIVGNGDAHLKNFGVLYSDPHANDVRMSPAFDIVCTTAYLPNDPLALTLGGSKSMFAARVFLHDFAERFDVEHPARRIDRLLTAAHDVLARERELLGFYPKVQAGLTRAVALFAQHTKPAMAMPSVAFLAITIDTSKAAFQDIGRNIELARLLDVAAEHLADAGDAAPLVLVDTNGNTVGGMQRVAHVPEDGVELPIFRAVIPADGDAAQRLSEMAAEQRAAVVEPDDAPMQPEGGEPR